MRFASRNAAKMPLKVGIKRASQSFGEIKLIKNKILSIYIKVKYQELPGIKN
jgi:hypothetical protein